MRDCNGCTKCCEGFLSGSARGAYFGNLIPCKYLVCDTCLVYRDRPTTCKTYYCAWAQGILSEGMKPSLVKVIVSVETDERGTQYLKAVTEVGTSLPMSLAAELDMFAVENDTYVVETKVIPIKKV